VAYICREIMEMVLRAEETIRSSGLGCHASCEILPISMDVRAIWTLVMAMDAHVFMDSGSMMIALTPKRMGIKGERGGVHVGKRKAKGPIMDIGILLANWEMVVCSYRYGPVQADQKNVVWTTLNNGKENKMISVEILKDITGRVTSRLFESAQS